jgi:hypothetical protein
VKFTPADARAAGGQAYATDIRPINTQPGRASTDADNTSWFAPLGHLSIACSPQDVPYHTREFAAMCVLPAAHKALARAGEILAASAVELTLNAPLLHAARAEFKAAMKGKRYDLPLERQISNPKEPNLKQTARRQTAKKTTVGLSPDR